jgi:hypothetical protein
MQGSMQLHYIHISDKFTANTQPNTCGKEVTRKGYKKALDGQLAKHCNDCNVTANPPPIHLYACQCMQVSKCPEAIVFHPQLSQPGQTSKCLCIYVTYSISIQNQFLHTTQVFLTLGVFKLGQVMMICIIVFANAHK